MYLFDITGEVKQYPYRATRVREHFLSLPLDDELKLYHEVLADAAHVRVNNHVVYRITHEGNTMYIEFSDLRVIFGWSIVE